MKAFLPLAFAVGLLAVGSGCQDDWQSFFVHDNKRLGEPPGCEIPTEASAAGLLGGLLDTDVSTSYAAYLFVENGMISRADPGLPRAESNGIFVQGAYLYYEPDPACPGSYPSQEVRFSNYIAPGGTATVGIWVIPPSVGQAMAETLAGCANGRLDVTVTIQMFGVTQAGTDMLTQEFDYPISVCAGCLIFCPTGIDLDPVADGCQCDCMNTEVELAEMPCHPGQDDYLDCRLSPECVR